MDIDDDFSRLCPHNIILCRDGDLILMILRVQSLNGSGYANALHLIMMKFEAVQVLLKDNLLQSRKMLCGRDAPKQRC